MSFHEIRFPVDISYGSAGGPEFSTDVVVTQSGYEQRNSNWAEARAKYNISYGVKTTAQLAALLNFFRARKGQAEGFRYKDWSDFAAFGESLGVGNGTQTQFQLVKHYSSGSVTQSRIITKPVQGTVKIYLNSVLKTTGVTVDVTTGKVTFTTAPAAGVNIQADFEFDVPVRFATDRLSATLDGYGSHSVRDIPLIEVRV
jgi:uncharacterized protein (TIGR02217 family)